MFLEEGIEHWEAVNRVNYLGVVYTLKAVVPGMVQRNSGRIIVTNSSGSFMGRKGQGSVSQPAKSCSCVDLRCSQASLRTQSYSTAV